MDAKERLMQIVEEKKDEFIKASDQIWSTPETRFAVEKSVQPYYEILEKEGFTIKKGIADMDYAFEATWGSGKPVIGMLAEYDALGNLSQVAGRSNTNRLLRVATVTDVGITCWALLHLPERWPLKP